VHTGCFRKGVTRARVEILTAVWVRNHVFWDVTFCHYVCSSRRFHRLWRFLLRGLSRHYVITLIPVRVMVVFWRQLVIIVMLFWTLSIFWINILYLLEVSGICRGFCGDSLYRINGNSKMSCWFGVTNRRTDGHKYKRGRWEGSPQK
jgi:hypothetical protein